MTSPPLGVGATFHMISVMTIGLMFQTSATVSLIAAFPQSRSQSVQNNNIRRGCRWKSRDFFKASIHSVDSDAISPQNGQSQRGHTKLTAQMPPHQKPPTSRYVAISALTSRGGGEQFAVRKLESDINYTQGLTDQRDRAYARLLVATVERRLGQIDKVLGECASKYPPKKGKHSRLIQATLRVGAAQILFLETPHHAAVKETVDVLRMQEGKSIVPEPMVKFVNAVLRTLTRTGLGLLNSSTSASDNIAPWLVESWKRSWGAEATERISRQLLEIPEIDLSVKYSSATLSPDKYLLWLEQLRNEFGDDAKILPHGSIRVGNALRGDVSNWPRYNDGVWWVQDASSTLPAIALYNTLCHGEDVSALHVVDMCAAPGGKTAQLLSMGFGCVSAIEANARRSRRLVENLDRLELGDRCNVIVSEGQKWVPEEGSEVTGVLLDVPCSATGTGSRRPDVLRRDEDLGNLLTTQEALANHCADNLIGYGGILIYSTCSLLKKESEEQVEKLIKRGNQGRGAVMKTLPFTPGDIPGFDDAIDKNGWLRVLPGMLGGDLQSCDGFFIARLVKIG